MGVAGSGKTLVGSMLARALHVEFVDGDEYHSVENVQKMARGIALTDEDRVAWLDSLAAAVRGKREAGSGLVIACSALKKKYRDVLRRDGGGDMQFIFLRGSRELLAQRLRTRRGHFMPESLLDSQFVTLEEPSPDEGAWVYDVSRSPEDIVASVVKLIST